ncbi:unnamed protein product [Arctia plantaginis]|uniref:FLYWCH-type domain-containing protein n=1 Tax=Arctia plantaginis TaxID=874455 RepID=A0A8S0ZPL9_ARCPL|nr:unnamed protein product [Arctia plantaginis]
MIDGFTFSKSGKIAQGGLRISNVSTLKFKDNVIKRAEERKNALRESVKDRLLPEYDLIEVEVKYHAACFSSFLKRSPSTENKPREADHVTEDCSLEGDFFYIENHEDLQFTLKEFKDPKLITLTSGHVLLLVEGYSFHEDRGSSKSRWRCSAKNRGCRACVTLDDNHTIIRKNLNHSPHDKPVYKQIGNAKLITISSTGKQYLMKNGYTYSRHVALKSGTRWSCTRSSKCRAHLLVSEEGVVIKALEDHNHERLKYFIGPDGKYIKKITLKRNGKEYMMKGGYTFYKHVPLREGDRWSCTQGCSSYLLLSQQGVLLKSVEKHKHEKPLYHILPDGKYVKL